MPVAPTISREHFALLHVTVICYILMIQIVIITDEGKEMTEQIDLVKEAEGKGFLRGVIFAVAELMRGHGDTVISKDVLDTLGGQLHEACRESSEYDVRALREVFPDLPFGNDADYDNLRLVSLDLDGRDCDQDDAYSFEVRGDYGAETLVIARFEELEAAQAFIRMNASLMMSGEEVDDE